MTNQFELINRIGLAIVSVIIAVMAVALIHA